MRGGALPRARVRRWHEREAQPAAAAALRRDAAAGLFSMIFAAISPLISSFPLPPFRYFAITVLPDIFFMPPYFAPLLLRDAATLTPLF